MSKHFKTEGIILRKFNLNEADRIVTVLTKEHGKIDCIAKGARRFRSKFLGRLELFNRVILTCFQGRTLAIVNEVEVLDCMNENRDIDHHRVIFYLAEITHKLIQEEQQVEGVYPMLCSALNQLDRKDKYETVLHTYLTKLLTLTGFLSPWNKCAVCDDSLNPEKPIWLSLTDASTVCHECRKPGDQTLSIALIKWVNFMQHYPMNDVMRVTVDEKDHQAVWQWLRGVLQSTLSTPLKSESFLQSSF